MSMKLDAAIAEALGYEVEFKKSKYGDRYITSNREWGCCCPTCGYDGLWGPNEVPKFTTDGNAMLELDREMRERGYDYLIRSVAGWRGKEESKETEVVFYKNNNEQVTGWRSKKEMPLIFAKQAYWALTGEEWQE